MGPVRGDSRAGVAGEAARAGLLAHTARTGWRPSGRACDSHEAEHYRIEPPDQIEAIKSRMEQHRLTRRDLEEIIGSRTRIAEVLNRKRGLSIAMIRRLHERLGISADVLIRPSRRRAA